MSPERNPQRAMAEKAAAVAAKLKADLRFVTDPQERASLRLRIRSCRSLERWARSRAGYR